MRDANTRSTVSDPINLLILLYQGIEKVYKIQSPVREVIDINVEGQVCKDSLQPGLENTLGDMEGILPFHVDHNLQLTPSDILSSCNMNMHQGHC